MIPQPLPGIRSLPTSGARAAVAVLLACAASTAQAGEVTLFAARVRPIENWGNGYGAALTTTWFHVIALEAEAARLPGQVPERIMTTFSGSAFLAPPIGGLVPYGGVGIGLFRQSVGARNDTGIVRTTVVGAKVAIKNLIVLRADYRWLRLSGEPPLDAESRLSIGVGVRF